MKPFDLFWRKRKVRKRGKRKKKGGEKGKKGKKQGGRRKDLDTDRLKTVVGYDF